MLFSLALAPIEKILNSYLQLDPESKKRLSALAGKVVVIEFQHFPVKIYWAFNVEGVRLFDKYQESTDVSLRGSPFDFMRLTTSKNTSAAIFGSDITVIGDMEVAEKFKALFANLDIDWEEQLSHVTGDVMAHQIGNFIRSISNWAKQSATILRQDITEYIQEEARWLPPREELQDFLTQVDTLRNDTERLELRLDKITKKTTSTRN